MQSITITGGLGRDSELKQTQAGQSILSFSVGSSQGYGDKKKTNWFRCTVWGDRGAKIAQYLLKGVKVTVQGELTIGDFEGKPQFDIRVNEVEFQSRADNASQGGGSTQYTKPAQSYADDDLEDFVPFVSNDMGMEWSVR